MEYFHLIVLHIDWMIFTFDCISLRICLHLRTDGKCKMFAFHLCASYNLYDQYTMLLADRLIIHPPMHMSRIQNIQEPLYSLFFFPVAIICHFSSHFVMVNRPAWKMLSTLPRPIPPYSNSIHIHTILQTQWASSSIELLQVISRHTKKINI